MAGLFDPPWRFDPHLRLLTVHWGGQQISVVAEVLSFSGPVDDMRWTLDLLNGAVPQVNFLVGWGTVIGIPAVGLIEEQPLRTATPPADHKVIKGDETDFKFSFRTFNGISSARFKLRVWASKTGYLAGSPDTVPRVFPPVTPPPPPPPLSALLHESAWFTLTSNQADAEVWQRRWLRLEDTTEGLITVQDHAF